MQLVTVTCILLWAPLFTYGAVAKTGQPRIIIVGAGVAGLGAATRLLERGQNNIKIIEAEDRIGGRVYSTPMGEWTVDYGAHWVHGGPGNPVYDWAAPLGLVEESGDDGNTTTYFSDGGVAQLDETLIYDEKLAENASLNGEFNNFSAYQQLWKCKKPKADAVLSPERVSPFLESVAKLRCTADGCDSLKDVSIRLAGDYLTLNSSQNIGWKGKGYSSIVKLLLNTHEKSSGPPVELGDKLLLNTEVTKIEVSEDGSGVKVHCSNGEVHSADLVLVTVSVGVLKERQDTLFQPQLPSEKKAAINAIGFGTVDKIILRFPTVWWPTEMKFHHFVWLDKDKAEFKGEYSWVPEVLGFASEAGSPYTLTGWMVGEGARDMERTPTDGVQKACMRLLRKFLGSTYNISEPVEMIRSKWGTNPHFRGSYSYRSLASEKNNVTFISVPLLDKSGKEVVFFAGEATHSYFYSTVHGALASGWREADRILANLKNYSN